MHPVGFGPYYLEEYNADEYMVFRKFKDYYGEKAPLERIKYVVIPETSPRIMGLLSGDYDIMGVLPDQFDVIKGKKGFEVLGGLINNIRILIYDSVSSPVLKDPSMALLPRRVLPDTGSDPRYPTTSVWTSPVRGAPIGLGPSSVWKFAWTRQPA
jgi:ABC-type transport system substrate-binding protein